MNEDREPELVVDDSVRAPAPLDPAIASTFLRIKSNRLADGFDLSVSAFFGTESVALKSDEFVAEVIISLDKALLELHFRGCKASTLEPTRTGLSDERVFEETTEFSSERDSSRSYLLRASASTKMSATQLPQAKGELDAGANRQTSTKTRQTMTRKRGNWQQISPSSLIVGTEAGTLDGSEVDDFVGWRVIPNSNREALAVFSTLSTRADWINFVDIPADGFGGKLGEKAKLLFRSDDQYRKKMFALLLRHLTALGLPSGNRSDEAVLAVHILFVRPDMDVQFNAPSEPKSRLVNIANGPIKDFLTSEPGREVETLVRLGVPRDAVASVQVSDGAADRVKERVFTAGSSPIAALKGYEGTLKAPLKVEEWQARFGKRTLTDLRNLGLVDLENGMVVPTHVDVTDPESNFRHSVAKSGTISSARAMLLKEPNASATDIVDVIAIKYGKSYSRGSKLRVGNAMKRWARWLEPHLIDPQGGSAAEMLRASATSKKAGIGQRSLRTPENLQIIRDGLAKGLPVTKIAAQMGLSAETIRGWRRRGHLDKG